MEEAMASQAIASAGSNPEVEPGNLGSADLVELQNASFYELDDTLMNDGEDALSSDLLANTQCSDEDAMSDDEVPHDDNEGSGAAEKPAGSQGPSKSRNSKKGSPGSTKTLHPKRRGPLAKIVMAAAKEMAAKFDVVSPKGQHKSAKQTRPVLPDFSPPLKQILEKGTKKEIAEVAESIATEIVDDMHAREGSGSLKYYNDLERELIGTFPNIKSPGLRNAMRRQMNKDTPLNELSEDSQGEEELKPKPGKKRRTFTKKNHLQPLRTHISYLNRTERKLSKRKTLVKRGAESFQSYGFSQILPTRLLRSEMDRAEDSSVARHQKAIKGLELTPEDSHFDDPGLAESFRRTFSLRSDILDLGTRAFMDIMRWYGLFKFKHFLKVEAEVYLGSAENVDKFFCNVDLTWKGIGNLPVEENMPEGLGTDEAAVYKFQKLIAPLGPSLVNFTTDQEKLPGETFSWPFIIHTDLQTIIRHQDIEWLDMTGLKEALGHQILMINVFELTFKNRSQLLLLLESLFFGYTAPLLSKNNVILMNKIMQLGQSDEPTP